MIKQIIGIILFSLCLQTGRGQANGDPDLFFGTMGSVQIDVDELDNLSDILVDSAGNSYLVGYSGYYNNGILDYDYVILKLDPNGNPDLSFGSNGVVRGDYPGFPFSTVSESGLVTDGIVFTGNGGIYSSLDSQHVFVGKIDFNGTPDSTFGTDGFYNGIYLGPYNESRCLLIHDTRILVGGATYDTAWYHRETAYVVCLNAYGQPDSTFAETGVVLWDSQNGLYNNLHSANYSRHADGTRLNDLAVTPWGEYFACGYYDTGGIFRVFSLCFDTNGDGSSTYGTSGAMIHDINPAYHQFAVVTDSFNGKMVLGVEFQNYGSIVLQTVDMNSALGSAEIFPFQNNQMCTVTDLLSTSVGLFVAGYARDNSNTLPGYASDYSVAGLFGSDLRAENFFGNNGLFVQDILANNEEGLASLEYAGGRLYAAGYVNDSSPGNSTDFRIVRVIADGIMAVSSNNSDNLRVYPNPVKQSLFVESGDLSEGAMYIRDITGCAISGKIDITGTRSRIDLEGLSPGTYYLHIRTGSIFRVVPFVKI